MSFWGRLNSSALAVIFLIAANGCSPTDSSPTDEEKEPHFVLGNSRFNSMDYTGAIEAFQESLEVNPRSAQAHYRLAQLFDTKEPDPAAAIYHYQEYLRLDAGVENAETIKDRILTCKQQLAADVMSMPTAPATMKQIETLTETNRQLQLKVDQLNTLVKQWSDYAASLQAAKNNSAPQNNSSTPGTSSTPDDMTAQAASSTSGSATPGKAPATHPAKTHTHIVLAGETLASIARKTGVSLANLEAANPDVSPKKLRVGQSLNLP